MEMVKKNILSVICGVIALLALVAWFWPIGGMFEREQLALNTKQADYKKLSTLVSAPRKWPVTGSESDPAIPLKRFPNEQIIDDGDRIKKLVHIQADKMLEVTVNGDPNLKLQGTYHATLLSDVFPNPRERRFNFQSAYFQAVQQDIPKLLEAVIPPDDEEIHAAADKLWKDVYEPKIVTVGGKAFNFQQQEQEWHEAADKLPEQMRTERAAKFKLYVDATALAVSRPMVPTPNQTLKDEDLWYAQNMIWVQRDVAEAIARINSTSANVMESPVKRLLKLELPDDASQYIQAGGGPGAQGAAAAPTPEALSGKAYSRTPTGRVCNPLYDVIQFTLQINVDARKIPMIISELERGRLVTIYQADASTVDAQAAVDDGYIYGPAPIVQLTLKGEQLFMRQWTVKMMPDRVKDVLQIGPADANAAAPAAAPIVRPNRND
ncbi:MAG: hypothetical protein JWP03_3101 [Phycisphaerales bacterium]|nr:hypothetical protein [Phycisphaerales bacterium]